MLNTNIITNRYPAMKNLCDKDSFANLMKMGDALNPGTFEFVPPTFQMPTKDVKKFEDYKEANKKCVFIAKPEAGAQGDNISLFSKLKDIPGLLANKGEFIV